MTLLPPLNPPLDDWTGRRIWLIGASSGIGAALARTLLARGARVALSARTTSKLGEVADAHPHALVVPLDVGAAEAWSPAYERLQAAWNGIDLIVFCAADYLPQRSWEVTAERVRQTLQVNIAGVYYGIETVLPDMLQRQGGAIAIVASVAGYLGLPQASLYGPSKAALINLAELLYGDLHPRGLSVYLVNPGFVRTRLTAKNSFAMPALQTPEQAAAHILRGIERGRFEIHFPYRFTLLIKLARLLPYRWRFLLFNRLAEA